MSEPRRTGLGRGLEALLAAGQPQDEPGSEKPPETPEGRLRTVPISAIQANPRQPREVFDDQELDGLAASIKEVGLLQPIVVRRSGEDLWELVAGERRLRAARRAGLAAIDVVIRDTEDGDLLREALIENIHRVQLNPLEEAAAYGQLIEDFDLTQDELAGRVGKSRSTIANALRLLQLPAAVQRRVASGVLTAGHAKALAGLPDAHSQESVAEAIVNQGLSVRATEELVRLRFVQGDAPRRGGGATIQQLPPSMEQLQYDLGEALGTRVVITMRKTKGSLAIDFHSPQELEEVVDLLAKGLQHRSELADPAG